MNDTLLDSNLSSGIFKFSDKVKVHQLTGFLKDNWVTNPRFTRLYIRGCDGDRKFGIGFEFTHEGQEDYLAVLDGAIGRLKRIFGDNFVGWDVSASTYIVLS